MVAQCAGQARLRLPVAASPYTLPYCRHEVLVDMVCADLADRAPRGFVECRLGVVSPVM